MLLFAGLRDIPVYHTELICTRHALATVRTIHLCETEIDPFLVKHIDIVRGKGAIVAR